MINNSFINHDTLSLLLGVSALVCSGISLSNRKNTVYRQILISGSAIILGIMAIMVQLFVIRHEVLIDDYWSLVDTIDGRILASVILITLLIAPHFFIIKRIRSVIDVKSLS